MSCGIGALGSEVWGLGSFWGVGAFGGLGWGAPGQRRSGLGKLQGMSTVNPIKLETGLRPNSAGIPYALTTLKD